MRNFSKVSIYMGLIACSLSFSSYTAATSSTNTSSQQAFFTPYISSLTPDSRVSLLYKQTGSPMVAVNQQELFPPASTLKLFTALAAKLELGDKFRYQTSLYKQGNDVIIRFSGDPSLRKQDLAQLFSDAKITSISGNLILDGSQFTGHERPIGLPWDTVGACYSAPASAISLDKNCVLGSVYTNNDGSTRAFVPKYQPVKVSTTAKTVTWSEQKDQFCTLDLASNPDNSYELSGCVTKRKDPVPLKFAIQNTALYTTAILKETLAKKNIKLSGTIKTTDRSTSNPDSYATVLAHHYSAYLPVLLKHMLQRSDNLYANNITKTLGWSYFKQPGSFKNGTQAIKDILQNKAGVNVQTAILEDGAGLTRNNRVTALHLYSVLRYIINHDSALNFISIMPVSGTSGTLQYRASMRNSDIRGKIVAKSGSVFATYNMAGFVLDANGKPNAIFVELVTDYHQRGDFSKPTPLQKFEGEFYRSIISKSN